ncbi:MAG: aldo/keto reductase [Candidatus Krumholzibacteria bacterium]|nr:aldo/keto reductase [Candidatus Krumholzibacteria bacterium]
MSEKKRITRRDLFKLGFSAGAAMTLSGVPGATNLARAEEEKPSKMSDTTLPQVPRRVLGKTGETVPVLLMGGSMNFDSKFDPKLAEAYRFGVNYIDVADCYNNGQCEAKVGSFVAKADLRKNVWITSKSDQHDPKGLERTLHTGLDRFATDYFDMYYLHAVEDPSVINDDLKATVERLKKEGKFRFFGFSCHDGNVDELLQIAAKTPWIDSVMFRYNFAQYGNKALNDAIDACVKTNVGLIAMKTQRSEVSFQDSWKKFQQKGKWSKHQAVLKAVWADERISAAVSHMDTFEKLKQNIAAAVDQYELGRADVQALERYATATRHEACDGCDHICGPTVDAPVKIAATLRYLMYHDMYGEKDKARELFRRLPTGAQRLRGVDFRPANAACPFGVNVVAHMERAAKVLAG